MAFTIIFPQANPFRVLGNDINLNSIDYANTMPRSGLMALNQEYQKGEYAVNYYPDWIINEQIKMQVWAKTSGDILARLLDENGTFVKSCTVTNISPAGWIAYPVWKITTSHNIAGKYYIRIWIEQDDQIDPENTTDIRFKTDVFKISDSLPTDKNLIKLEYKNTSNKYSMVWDDYYTAFYTGTFKPAEDSQENTITEVDTGVSKQNSINHAGIDATFTAISQRYYEVLCKQLQCDTIRLNGIDCVCNESPKITLIDNSDNMTVTAKLLYAGSNDEMNLF